jgi:hypothetical protein
MKITVHGGADMARALEFWPTPEACDELIIDAPSAKRFTNCLLNSPINCRVTVVPTENDAVSYAGLFSGCRFLQHQPVVDVSKCFNMAAMFKQAESLRCSLYQFRQTSQVRDMRQCLWGASGLSGNGLCEWDFSSLSSPNAMRHFAGSTKLATKHYDELIQSLYYQAVAKTLPTPMRAVDFGSAQYSPLVARMRAEIIAYGWEIIDGGVIEVGTSPFEESLARSVDDILKGGEFPNGIDLSPVVRSARNGILISPQHVLYVRHYQPTVGQRIEFWNGESAVIERCTAHHLDVAVAKLRDPVSVRPALVLPEDWESHMPTAPGPPIAYPAGARPAVVWFNQDSEIGVEDFGYVHKSVCFSTMTRSPDPLRSSRHVDIRIGDSGAPVCFVHKGRLLVLHAMVNGRGDGVCTGAINGWLKHVTEGKVHVIEVQ